MKIEELKALVEELEAKGCKEIDFIVSDHSDNYEVFYTDINIVPMKDSDTIFELCLQLDENLIVCSDI